MSFFSRVPSVSVADAAARAASPDAVLVDVRSPHEYAGGHAQGAINCPLPSLSACVDKLKRYSEVYVICQSGGRSSAATTALLGTQINAVNVAGGTLAWHAAGLPLA